MSGVREAGRRLVRRVVWSRDRYERRLATAARECTRLRAQVADLQREAAREHNAALGWEDEARDWMRRATAAEAELRRLAAQAGELS